MRIIAGTHRGLTLVAVGAGDPAAHLRPTPDRVRESIFNILANPGPDRQNPIVGARVLDLFAGTGAMGLEALSRGAAHVSFVDNGAAALTILRRNVEKMRATDVTEILRRDATRLGDNSAAPFDLVFLDPPYGKRLGQLALASAQAGGWIAPGATLVWEESAEQTVPQGFSARDSRRYGATWATFLTADAATD